MRIAPTDGHLQLSRARPPYRLQPWHMYGFAIGAGGVGAALSSLGLAWLVVPVPFVAVLAYQGWHGGTLYRYRARALECLETGHYDGAGDVYDELAHKRNVHFKIAGLMGLGVVELRRGNTREAEQFFGEIRRNPSRVPPIARELTLQYLSMCATLRGDLMSAEEYLRMARALTPVLGMAYALLGARGDEHDEVGDLDPPQFRRGIARLFAHEIRAFHMLRAYSCAARTDDAPPASDREQARPAFDTEYDYLTTHWPELRTFIDTHPWPAIGVAADATLPRAQIVR